MLNILNFADTAFYIVENQEWRAFFASAVPSKDRSVGETVFTAFSQIGWCHSALIYRPQFLTKCTAILRNRCANIVKPDCHERFFSDESFGKPDIQSVRHRLWRIHEQSNWYSLAVIGLLVTTKTVIQVTQWWWTESVFWLTNGSHCSTRLLVVHNTKLEVKFPFSFVT